MEYMDEKLQSVSFTEKHSLKNESNNLELDGNRPADNTRYTNRHHVGDNQHIQSDNRQVDDQASSPETGITLKE